MAKKKTRVVGGPEDRQELYIRDGFHFIVFPVLGNNTLFFCINQDGEEVVSLDLEKEEAEILANSLAMTSSVLTFPAPK